MQLGDLNRKEVQKGGYIHISMADSFCYTIEMNMGFPGGSDGKESACNAGDQGWTPWVRKIPWSRKWQPTPVFLPGEFHGQRSLASYRPWGCKESDTTGQLTLSLFRN